MSDRERPDYTDDEVIEGLRRFQEAQRDLPRRLRDAFGQIGTGSGDRVARSSSTSNNRPRPAGPEWIALVRNYRATKARRPTLIQVAEEFGWQSEQPLRDLIHRLGIKRWHDVHALVASEAG